MNSSTLSINRPRSLSVTVAERLRQAIIDADLALGAELSEASLAAKLGVSRTPVREALSLLHSKDWLLLCRNVAALSSFRPSKTASIFANTASSWNSAL